MRRLLLTLGCVGLLVLNATALHAQAHFGGQVSWGDNADLGIGARAIVALRSLVPGTPLEAHAAFDYFFPDEAPGVDLGFWEINANVAYLIPGVRAALTPYVGGGINIAHTSADFGVLSTSDTDAGLNLIAGAKFKLRGSPLTPFAELRIELGGGDQFVLSAGIVF